MNVVALFVIHSAASVGFPFYSSFNLQLLSLEIVLQRRKRTQWLTRVNFCKRFLAVEVIQCFNGTQKREKSKYQIVQKSSRSSSSATETQVKIGVSSCVYLLASLDLNSITSSRKSLG